MYVPQAQTPLLTPVQPVTTAYVPVQPQPSISYVLVPQTQTVTTAYIPVTTPMPIVNQKPLQPAIPYHKFIPPTPTKRAPDVPKIYQFYHYVPVVQTTGGVQTVEQQIQPVPIYQTLDAQLVPTMNYTVV